MQKNAKKWTPRPFTKAKKKTIYFLFYFWSINYRINRWNDFIRHFNRFCTSLMKTNRPKLCANFINGGAHNKLHKAIRIHLYCIGCCCVCLLLILQREAAVSLDISLHLEICQIFCFCLRIFVFFFRFGDEQICELYRDLHAYFACRS